MKMAYLQEIERFQPANEQEAADQTAILAYLKQQGDHALLREDAIAHITSSGFIMDRHLDKVLLVHHNIRRTWAWTGGHADGDPDLLHVALKEAREETGAAALTPLSREIASLDLLPVLAHRRKGCYVNAHLHLSVAYLLIGDEREAVRPRLAENTAVAWFPTSYFTSEHFDPFDVYLYNKLIARARTLR